MNLVRLAVRQPVTVTVGVLLILLAGVVALQRIPIQLTPNVEDTIIAVTTRWEGASPLEIEREIVDRQEEKLQGLTNLRSITSTSQQGQGVVRLEFAVGTPKEVALREVGDKLREVPSYPQNVDEPVIEASDPENRDYIAWIILHCDDPSFDVRTLQDFAEDRVKPVLERVPGVSEINVLGGTEREVQVRYDPALLAAKGITPSAFAEALRRQNLDVSAGALRESKDDVRLRLAGQFTRVVDVESTVVTQTAAGPVLVRDVATVVETYKEPRTFVRSRGKSVLAINAQREVGSNVMAVMAGLREAFERLNGPEALLAVKARQLGLQGGLRLEQVYDQTVYIDDALALVRDNIWIGGLLAIAVLALFLRSVRTVGIVALAIPISVVGAVVFMVSLGRSINVISLAGMAFAVGMVVDNAIVVLENIYRHIEMGKPPARAALDGGNEVYGAVLASTLTTVAVFVPILLIQEEAGQLFRDISLAIVAAVALSLLVSVTVIPSAAARLLQPRTKEGGRGSRSRVAALLARSVYALCGSTLARLAVVVTLTVGSLLGTWWLMPPTDYLPQGNRNLVFGLLIPPPGYHLEQQGVLAERIESTIRPFWEAAQAPREGPAPERPAIPTFDPATGRAGSLVPPPLDNYFLVSFDGIMFHGGISADPARVVDVLPLFAHATRSEVAPGVLAFAFQVPLFQLGGRTGSAIKINLAGDDLAEVARAAEYALLELFARYSPYSVQPDPSNFNVPTPELRLEPQRVRIAEAGLTFEDVALAVRSVGDGAVIGEYRKEGDSIDLKVIAQGALGADALELVPETPIASPRGAAVPLSSLVRPVRVNAAQQINRVGRQRAITLQFTPPRGLALEQAVAEVAGILEAGRAQGRIGPEVDTSFTGSASKLEAVRGALLGDGSALGTLRSSLALALLVVYLLMCVLFQSFLHPLVIMFSVPLATLGGFAALRATHEWSLVERYMPVQQLDILTMLGFVILIGVVVNNAILIVHQTLNFMAPAGPDEPEAGLAPREAIREAVRSRVRPIFMSTFTSVLGMLPLVVMPGSGSELYRGLGSVVVGGLVVSTFFTLFLVPTLLSLALDLRAALGFARVRAEEAPASGAAPLRSSAAVLLAGLLLALGSCGTSGASDAQSQHASRLTRELVDSLPVGRVPSARPGAPEDRIATTLETRREELERLGGPESWLPLGADHGPSLTGAEEPGEPLTLEEALRLAVEHNLGLRLSRLGPDSSREGVMVERSGFDPVLFSELFLERIDRPRPVPVLGGIQLGVPFEVSDRRRIDAGIRSLLSSGATVSASGFFERFDNQAPGIDFLPNPAFTPGLSLAATQPLLAGRGSEVTQADLRLAESSLERAQLELSADVLSLAALAEQAYWNLREAHARLRIQERLTLEGEEVERVLRLRRDFDAQPAQYADALATLEQRRANLIRARALLRASSDRLKALLDWERTPLAAEGVLEPISSFTLEPLPLDLRASIAEALERRPEVRAALLDIEDADLRARVAENLRRPRLDAFGAVQVTGQDDSPGSATASLAEDDFLGWLVGLRFELPIGNRGAAAESRRARIEARAALLRYEERLRDLVLEVKEALRQLVTSYELVGATRALRVAQTENLRALRLEEERRSSLTPEFLRLKFDRQERLAAAQLEELQAIANFNRARAAYRRALGTGPVLDAGP